jgi:hypothetical protein
MTHGRALDVTAERLYSCCVEIDLMQGKKLVRNSHRRPARIGVVFTVAATLVACGTETIGRLSGASTTPMVVAQNQSHFQYALFVDNRWQLKEAIDPVTTDPLFQQERPPLAWYAEYERFVPDSTDPRAVLDWGPPPTQDRTICAPLFCAARPRWTPVLFALTQLAFR